VGLEPADCRLFAANGTTINVISEKTLDVHVGDLTIPTRFVVSSNVTEPMLGVNWLRSNRVIWDFAKDLPGTLASFAKEAIVPGQVEINRMDAGIKGHKWTTEANELSGGILVAKTVVPERLDNVPVLVLNSSNV